MNWKLNINIIGAILIVVAIFMLAPIAISVYCQEADLFSLVKSQVITFIAGLTAFFSTKDTNYRDLKQRDGFIVVTFVWIFVSFFGALPFYFSHAVPDFTNAYFESMSGFTTTGASVIADVESLSKGLIFWRSLTHWIGGMGIVLFSLAVLPMLSIGGTGGIQLYRAEVPEISFDKMRPRIVDTVKTFWYIYVGLTAVAAFFYVIGGMTIFDAVNHAFATIATGGFSTKNNSIVFFHSHFIEIAATIFMFLSSVNFTLYFFALKGDFSRFLKNTEFKFYFCLTLTVIMLVTFNVWRVNHIPILDSLRLASFQVVSMISTTGFASADYEQWSSFAQSILIGILFFGGMIGSTSGGIKQIRIALLIKHFDREIYRLIHPRAIVSVKMDGKNLPKEVLEGIGGFVALFLFVYSAATLTVTFFGVDFMTAYSTVISCMVGCGPALGLAGPMENYFVLPAIVKWILSFCMLLGRLEVYTVIVLFTPYFWKK